MGSDSFNGYGSEHREGGWESEGVFIIWYKNLTEIMELKQVSTNPKEK